LHTNAEIAYVFSQTGPQRIGNNISGNALYIIIVTQSNSWTETSYPLS
jgi:hypothetical protein